MRFARMAGSCIGSLRRRSPPCGRFSPQSKLMDAAFVLDPDGNNIEAVFHGAR
jgi:hypothetical protein